VTHDGSLVSWATSRQWQAGVSGAARWESAVSGRSSGGKRSWWWRRRVGIGGFCGRIGVGIGGQRTINRVGNDRGGAARSAGFRGVGGRAGRHRQRGRGKRMETWGDSGQPLLRYEPWWHPRIPAARLGGTPHPRYDPWWPHDGPWRALMAARIPFTARIGVGAVQNRRPDHRVISTVCGDAGRPAHQRTETPHCARHRDAPIPHVCGPTARRSPPRRPPTHQNTPLRGAAMCRFAPVCRPAMRRSPPR
jgi:hypothetical protein